MLTCQDDLPPIGAVFEDERGHLREVVEHKHDGSFCVGWKRPDKDGVKWCWIVSWLKWERNAKRVS